MEVALSPHFLDSMILFSSHTNFERVVKQEIWLCHEHMNLSMDDILKMTVADRKDFISIHNREVKIQKNKFEERMRKKGK